jgi:hypothetical protein
MTEPVSVTFKLTRPEFYGIWRKLHSRQRRTLPLCGVVILAVGIFIPNITLTVIGAALTAWWTAYLYVLLPRRFWERFAQIRETHALTFTDHNVTEDLFQAKSTFDWNYWTDLTMAGEAYVLKSNRGYTFIPRRAFSTTDDEQRFRQLAAHLLQDQDA